MFLTQKRIFKSFSSLFFLTSVIIFLINTPPINILGISKNLIAKILIIIVFFRLFLNKKIKIIQKKTLLENILLFFLIIQSLSLLKTIDITLFFNKYQNIVFFILIVFIFNRVINKTNINLILETLLISCLFETIFEFLVLQKSFFFINLVRYLDYQYINYAYMKGKLDYPNFTYTFTPFLIYFLIDQKKEKEIKFLSLLILIFIFYNSLISNNRTFFTMLIFNLFFSFLLLHKQLLKLISKNKLITIIIFTIFLGVIFFVNLYRPFPNLTLDRLLLTEKNYETIYSRVNIWKKAIEVGLSNIFLGVGLGNFLFYIPTKIYLENYILRTVYRIDLDPAYSSPHNLFLEFFSESGVFSLVILIFLFLYFFLIDIKKIFFGRILLKKLAIIFFWSLFIFLFFNPVNNIKFYLFFSFSRILIES